jgi:hypothetical protein
MADKPRRVVVMPAYNAEKTLHRTHAALPSGGGGFVILALQAALLGLRVAEGRIPLRYFTKARKALET